MSKSDHYRVLIVDADTRSRESLAEHLEAQSFHTSHANSTREGARLVQSASPDLVIVGMETEDDPQTAWRHSIRETSAIPIIVRTNGSEEECLAAFTAGADDCISRSASMREVTARVTAVLRRSNAEPYRTAASQRSGNSHGMLVVGNVRLELTTCRVMIDDVTKTLTPNEFRLMAVFMREPGEVFTREDLRRRVWPDDQHSLHLVEVHIANLRAKIEPDAHHPKYIVTVRSRGYKFSTE